MVHCLTIVEKWWASTVPSSARVVVTSVSGSRFRSTFAKKLVPELEEHGSITRGWLGVSIRSLKPELASSLGLTESRRAFVADVTEGSPAAKGGVERGDVIVGFNGKKVNRVSLLCLASLPKRRLGKWCQSKSCGMAKARH